MFVEDLKIKLVLDQYHVPEDDVSYQEQKMRKMALKDELRERVLSMLERAQRESSVIRKETEKLRKQATVLAEETMNQRKSLEEHMDCEAKVTPKINSYLLELFLIKRI